MHTTRRKGRSEPERSPPQVFPAESASPPTTALAYSTTVLAPKGGVGKTLLARAVIDRYRVSGIAIRIVQIDRTPQLPELYGDLVNVVSLPGAEEQRADPLAAILALEPYAAAIDATLADNMPLVVDVGGGLYASATVEYIGKSRLDAHLSSRLTSLVLVPILADPASMSQSIELCRVIETVHPSARIVCVLNERDGRHKFYPGSSADRVWRSDVAPFVQRHSSIVMPAIPAGALAPFDGLGLTFTDIIESEAVELGRRLGLSRAVVATLQGDVAEWLAMVWSSLDGLLPMNNGAVDASS